MENTKLSGQETDCKTTAAGLTSPPSSHPETQNFLSNTKNFPQCDMEENEKQLEKSSVHSLENH